MSEYHNCLTAEQLIRDIANSYIEMSHEKIEWQRNLIIKDCKEWLEANVPPKPFEPPKPLDDNF